VVSSPTILVEAGQDAVVKRHLIARVSGSKFWTLTIGLLTDRQWNTAPYSSWKKS
jgi:hypothetical protein